MTRYQELLDMLTRETEECLKWHGSTNAGGYGLVRVNGKCRLVTRVTMTIKLGRQLDTNELVCHRCDNPICFNPKHLFIGTAKDNSEDMFNKGRAKQVKVPPEYRAVIKVLYRLGSHNVKELSKAFGVTRNRIWIILREV